MKKSFLLFLLILNLLPVSAFAGNSDTLARFLYTEDLKVWLGGGKSKYDWSGVVNKDSLISRKSVFAKAIYDDFNSNVFSAIEKYNRSPQIVDVIVDSVQAGNKGEPLVAFSVSGGSFYAKGFNIEEARQLKKGARYDVVCTEFKYVDSILASPDCKSLDRFTLNLAVELFDNAKSLVDSIPKTSELNIRNIIFDYVKPDDLQKFNEMCGLVKYSQECLKRSELMFADAVSSFSIDALRWLDCYRSSNKCDGIIDFSLRYNVDFQSALNKEIEREKLKKDLKRKEVIRKFTDFLK